MNLSDAGGEVVLVDGAEEKADLGLDDGDDG